MNRFMRFMKDEEGVTAIEYALIAALVALFITVALRALGTSLATLFGKVGTCLGGGSCTI